MLTTEEWNNLKEKVKTTHAVWRKFSNWLTSTFGKDLWGKWNYVECLIASGKTKKLKYRDFNDIELSRRLYGYDVMCKIEKYIKRCCPEIKIVHCDDHCNSGSFLLLIPHPKMGITVMIIPQCTGIQNKFFLYDGHFKMLIDELSKMKYVYKNSL